MNGAGNPRNAAYNDHILGSLPDGVSSHIPSSYLGAQRRENFERDITPADSISNVDYRSAPSSPQKAKANGTTRITTERRTERIHMSVRQNIRTSVRSPTKEAPPHSPAKKELKESKEFQPSRVSSRAVEKSPIYPTKVQKTLRESTCGKKADPE